MDRSNTRDTPEIKAEEGLHQKRNSKGDGNRTRLVLMTFLTFLYFIVEIVVGYWTGSVALVADSFHMLSDVMSLVIAYLAVTMSPKDWTQNTFGWARAEVLGALVNGVFLAALCFSIVVEALERFIDEPKIKEPKLILVVGSVGLLVNLIGLALFHNHGHSHGGSSGGHGHSHGIPKRSSSKHQHSHSHNGSTSTSAIVDGSDHKINLVGFVRPMNENGNLSESKGCANKETGKNCQPGIEQAIDSVQNMKTTADTPLSSPQPNVSSASQMNMRGVFLHVLADALGSVIVMISALIIWLTEWKYKMYIDPVLSIVMVILILASVWPLLQESAMVLLQTVPTHIQIDELKQKLLAQVPGTLEVHEFHIWQLAGNRIIASAHILCNDSADYMRIGEQVKEIFHNEGIHSTTIQLEYASNENESPDNHKSPSSDCFLTCPGDMNGDCASNSCCGVRKRLGTTVATNLAFISESPPSLGRNIA